jgi:hypothetical protein
VLKREEGLFWSNWAHWQLCAESGGCSCFGVTSEQVESQQEELEESLSKQLGTRPNALKKRSLSRALDSLSLSLLGPLR